MLVLLLLLLVAVCLALGLYGYSRRLTPADDAKVRLSLPPVDGDDSAYVVEDVVDESVVAVEEGSLHPSHAPSGKQASMKQPSMKQPSMKQPSVKLSSVKQPSQAASVRCSTSEGGGGGGSEDAGEDAGEEDAQLEAGASPGAATSSALIDAANVHEAEIRAPHSVRGAISAVLAMLRMRPRKAPASAPTGRDRRWTLEQRKKEIEKGATPWGVMEALPKLHGFLTKKSSAPVVTEAAEAALARQRRAQQATGKSSEHSRGTQPQHGHVFERL